MSAHEALRLLKSAAARVRDPVSGQSLQQAGMVGAARFEDGRLIFQVTLTPRHDPEQRQRLLSALARQVRHAGWEGPVDAEIAELPAYDAEPAACDVPGGEPEEEPTACGTGGDDPGLPPQKAIPGVKRIIAVASGKGGVGKSTVAVQLALALRDQGYAVGLMDSDIYGPSLPMMLGVNQRPHLNEREKIIPIRAHGLRCMSVGFLIGDKTPLIWRGPMVMGVVKQFLEDVDWAGLDYLVIDLPPGTGDAQLSMAQLVPVDGAVIVSTPGALALLDAVRGLEMFEKLGIPILGVVENMAWYELPGGARDFPFGEGGARRLAEERGVALLAEIPLDGRLRVAGDTGQPELPAELSASGAFQAMASAVAGALPV
ncbi:MAG: Mrp/NBP35 family ATP-binding protein [Pseudomonadota bacterium]